MLLSGSNCAVVALTLQPGLCLLYWQMGPLGGMRGGVLRDMWAGERETQYCYYGCGCVV